MCDLICVAKGLNLFCCQEHFPGKKKEKKRKSTHLISITFIYIYPAIYISITNTVKS